MCRLYAYLGPALALDALLVDPRHSLVDQSRYPRELPPGMLNADGYGVAWFSPGRPDAAVFRCVLPMWADENLPNIAPHLRSRCVLASTRSATRSMPVSVTNTAPFTHHRHALVHNGAVEKFHDRVMAPLRAALRPEHAAAIRGNTDSEHLFALLRTHLDALPLDAALRRTLADVGAWSLASEVTAQLNAIATDGETVVAARHAVGDSAPSLYVRERPEGGADVASEAVDDDRAGWRMLAPDTLVVLREGRVAREEPLSSA